MTAEECYIDDLENMLKNCTINLKTKDIEIKSLEKKVLELELLIWKLKNNYGLVSQKG